MPGLPNWFLALIAVGCGSPQEGEDPETCYDAVDNDGDGLLDCDDGGCAQAAGCGGDTGEADSGALLCINEFMASNAQTSVGLENDLGEPLFPDWIELFSALDHPLTLAGFTVTDDLADPMKHVLGDLVLPAGGYLLLFADGDARAGPAHLSFRLSAGGEQIGVYTPAGRAMDRLEYGAQQADWSAARVPDGNQADGAWQIVQEPTPGAPNEAR
ncbi:MAG: lamin tail domain-containing protein [Deltaproteobacteria bacterium]|nr:lamin tail domain-containing protein [Deltaproteobacteria bacterium]